MLNLDLQVILDKYTVSAGDTLTGNILLSPPRASPSPSATLESLVLTAKCEVRIGFEDSHGNRRSSVSHPYLIEKQLVSTPTEISRETSLRFALTLPRTSSWSPSLWNPSARFEHKPSHAIPGNFEDIIHHTLTVEAKTASKLFSKSKREIPYHFLPTRATSIPSPNAKAERQPIKSQPSSSWRRTWETVKNPSHSAGFPATAELKVTLPTQLYIGGSLPIRLSPSYHDSHQGGPGNSLFLKSFELRLIARNHVRAKLAQRMPGSDGEAEHTTMEKIELDAADFADGSVPITENMRLEELMECNLVESVGCAPSFRTYNAALRYTLELVVVVGVGRRQSQLVYRRNVEVLPAEFRAVEQCMLAREEGGELQWMRQQGCEMDGGEELPAYSDPPPEYVAPCLAEVRLERL